MKLVKKRESSIRTFKLLDDIVTILGGTKMSFYPFLTRHGTDIFPYGAGNDGIVGVSSDESTAIALEAEFDPIALVGGTNGYYFDSDTNNHINFADDAVFSHVTTGSDTVCSFGAWIYMTEALGSIRSIWAKHLGAAEEYDFRLDTSGFPELELHDASESATEIATSDDAVTPFVWQFVVATYDASGGTSANAGIALYINGAAVSAITLSGSAAYADMEDGGAIPMIGGRNSIAAVAQEFEGYIALPFQTGVELTSANVSSLYAIGQKLIGLA